MTKAELLAVAKPILFNTDMVKAILDNRKRVTRRVIKESFMDKYYEYDEYCNLVMPSDIHCVRDYEKEFLLKCSRYQVGDILYVRETWCEGAIDCGEESDGRETPYVSQCVGEKSFIPKEYCLRYDIEIEDVKWRPSIHMPKEVARLFLRVTGVRVERLQDITEEQAIAEGITKLYDYLTISEYEQWAKNVGVSDKKQCDWNYTNYLWHGHVGKTITASQSDGWNHQSSDYHKAVDSFSSLWQSLTKKQDLDTYGWDANPYVWVYEFERVDVDE